MKKELQVTRDCLHYLRQLPHVKIWRNHTGLAVFRSGMTVPVGIPSNGGGGDFIGMLNGQFLSIEFKSESQSVIGPKQIAWAKFVNSNGGKAVVIDSLETCKKLFPLN